jgi:hypothetical protein
MAHRPSAPQTGSRGMAICPRKSTSPILGLFFYRIHGPLENVSTRGRWVSIRDEAVSDHDSNGMMLAEAQSRSWLSSKPTSPAIMSGLWRRYIVIKWCLPYGYGCAVVRMRKRLDWFTKPKLNPRCRATEQTQLATRKVLHTYRELVPRRGMRGAKVCSGSRSWVTWRILLADPANFAPSNQHGTLRNASTTPPSGGSEGRAS